MASGSAKIQPMKIGRGGRDSFCFGSDFSSSVSGAANGVKAIIRGVRTKVISTAVIDFLSHDDLKWVEPYLAGLPI